jgi:hypothetical protein
MADMGNPYLQNYANSIATNANNNLQRNILPGINQQALANGGIGGSRQGIAQGLAIGDTQNAISNAQAQLYSNSYGQDQQYNLGLGQLGLNSTIANQNFYTNQRGQDLQQANLGASLASQGNQGLYNQGQNLYNTGQAQFQAPYNALNYYTNTLSPFSGLNQTQTSNSPSGSTLGNVVGGALTAAQLWKLFGG